MTDLYVNQPVPGLPSYFNRDAIDDLRGLCNRLEQTSSEHQSTSERSSDQARRIAATLVLQALTDSRVYSSIEVGPRAKPLMKVSGWVIVELPGMNEADRKLIKRVYDEIEKSDVAGFVSNMTEDQGISIPTRKEAMREWGLVLHIPIHCIDSIVERFGPVPSVIE